MASEPSTDIVATLETQLLADEAALPEAEKTYAPAFKPCPWDTFIAAREANRVRREAWLAERAARKAASNE